MVCPEACLSLLAGLWVEEAVDGVGGVGDVRHEQPDHDQCERRALHLQADGPELMKHFVRVDSDDDLIKKKNIMEIGL